MTRNWRVVETGRACAVLACLLLLAACSSSKSVSDLGANKGSSSLHHYQMARVFFEQGHVPEALSEIDRSLRIDGSLPQVWFYRGYIYFNQDKFDLAEADFRRAIERNEYYTDARMWLAACLDKLGRPQEGLAELDHALSDHSFAAPEQIYLNKGLILKHMNDLDGSLRELRQAVTVRPRFYRAHFEMGRVLMALGQFDAADLAFETAQPEYIKDPEFHFARGVTLRRLGRQREAQRELQRVIELAPGSEPAQRATVVLREIG